MRYGFACALLCALALGTGCSNRQRVRAETALADAVLTPKNERELGERIHAQLRADGMRMVGDHDVEAYVDDITERIHGAVRHKRSVRDLHVHVVDDPRVVNAFATPGGHVYVFSGLLLDARDEAEVAGVLAHEIGHVAARHVARHLVYAYGAQAVAGLALGKDPTLLEQLAAGVVTQGFLARHSQSEELEADRLGLGYAARADYDPRGMVRFFARLLQASPDAPAFVAVFQSHPPTRARIEDARKRLRAMKVHGGEVGADRHQRIVRRLRALRKGEGAVDAGAP